MSPNAKAMHVCGMVLSLANWYVTCKKMPPKRSVVKVTRQWCSSEKSSLAEKEIIPRLMSYVVTETGFEAIERLRFLTSFPPPGTCKREGGEKTQPFNCFASHPVRLSSLLLPVLFFSAKEDFSTIAIAKLLISFRNVHCYIFDRAT